MSQPTTGILLNSTAPAAPAGNQNAKPQSDGATPLQSISFYPQPATAALLGVVKPDGTSITVDATGKISAVASLTNPMTTAGDIIVGGAAGAPTRLAAGAAASVLTSNGPGVAPSYQSAAGGGSAGALVLLEQHTASNSAELDFTASFSATYDDYQIEILGLIPATNGGAALLQFSTNGGSSYDTSGVYDWGHNNCTLGGSSGQNGQTGVAGVFIFADSVGTGLLSTATPGMACSLKIYDPLNAANYKYVAGSGIAQYSGNSLRYIFTVAGAYRNLAAANAFRIIMSSGNIAAGTVRCYGVAKA
ncbi:MAG: hypothetical protein ACYCPO_06545 [Acidobacteriaceae bacterium]